MAATALTATALKHHTGQEVFALCKALPAQLAVAAKAVFFA
jgi:hypothetical protein